MLLQKVKKSQLQTDHFCKICNKFYASASSLCHHNKKYHQNVSPNITIIDTNNPNNTV